MDIQNSFLSQMATGDLTNLSKANNNNLALNFNCVRIGIIQEFYPANLTAKVKIASKRVLKINVDGTQTVRDYAPIIAKVCYSSPYETHPLKAGDEVVLLFNDRELETWFINGQANTQNHERMHDLTDAIALVGGIRSMPRMIEILLDCLHLFYGDSDIQLKADSIISNTPDASISVTNTATLNATNLNISAETEHIGDVTIDGKMTSSTASIGNGATGTFISQDNKTITVTNGIVTGIN